MANLLPANMDYVVDDVVRRVSSSSRRNRNVDGGSTTITGGGRGGISAGSGIPGVVEAVLRIGGSAMGPALVRVATFLLLYRMHVLCEGEALHDSALCPLSALVWQPWNAGMETLMMNRAT